MIRKSKSLSSSLLFAPGAGSSSQGALCPPTERPGSDKERFKATVLGGRPEGWWENGTGSTKTISDPGREMNGGRAVVESE